MKPNRFALRAIPAAIALAFSQTAWTVPPINVGGDTSALPTNGNANSAVTSAGISGNTMSIAVDGRAVINWSTFNIGSGYTVSFTGAGRAVLNKVPGGDSLNGSTIAGNLNGSNMLVMLMNPNGIAFTSTAVVNVGALVATTGTINEGTFVDTGNVAISGATGSISNAGHITASGWTPTGGAAQNGLVALVAPSVTNSTGGVITATGGKILLAGADAATISMNGLYEFAVTGSGTEVTNATGATLNAGTLYLSTRDAANVLTGTINLDGVEQASTIVVNAGTVELRSSLGSASVSGNSNVANVHKVGSGGGRIQDGVNVVQAGGTVNVGAGTFAETVTIKKALTLDGAGMGQTIIQPTTSNLEGIVIQDNVGTSATVAITDLTIQGAKNGIRIADNANVGTVTLDGVAVRNSASNGFISSNGGSTSRSTVGTINILNSVFAGNGFGNGSADINLYLFNGAATLQNLEILGTRSTNPANATDFGLQIRGYGEISTMTAAGHVLLDNVHISGTYKKAHLAVQRYSDGSNILMNGVVLGGARQNISIGNGATVGVASSSAGWGAFFSSDMTGTMSFGNTSFAGGAFGVGDIWVGGSTDGLRIDASQTEFSDITRTHTAAGAENFAIEDRVKHALDDASIGGLVIWQAGDLYVTTSSGSIQRGVNAASAGDTVHVGAGTFHEQLKLSKSLTLAGAGADQTIVAPTSLAADVYTAIDSSQVEMRNILTVSGASTSAEVSGFTFQGPVAGITSGIFVRDGAYANIHDNKVVNIREPGLGLSGNQTGVGIFVGRALLGTSGTALIENNVITGYQKGGIVVDGPGSQATITGNTVLGEGPTTALAQNGIQVSRGANATVAGNDVRGNVYKGVRNNADDFAAGILYFISEAYLGQGGVTLGSSNVITANEFGIWTNDPGTLATINVSAASGNTRNAVAYFNGGYQTESSLLKYPAWSAANTAFVSSGTFSGQQTGDILDFGGGLRVYGWSGFAAIQPAVDAVATGGTVNVGSGTYAENVVVNQLRNLSFDHTTLNSLTLNAGAAGSGIGGSVTASMAPGITFNAPVVLLGDATLATNGADLTFNGDIQNSGTTPYALNLTAGSGNIKLVSGGTSGNPLGVLNATANNFTLTGTLWVSRYGIGALGLVTLSDHTLRQIGGGATNTINAGTGLTGSTIAEGGVQAHGNGDVVLNVTAQGDATVTGTNVTGNFSGNNVVVGASNSANVNVNATQTASLSAGDTLQGSVNAPFVGIQSNGPATMTGAADKVVYDVPTGSSLTGNFGQTTNAGTGLVKVNGRPEGNATLSANADNSRVLPSEGARSSAAAGSGPQETLDSQPAEFAGDSLDQGRSVEIDLTPGERRRRRR